MDRTKNIIFSRSTKNSSELVILDGVVSISILELVSAIFVWFLTKHAGFGDVIGANNAKQGVMMRKNRLFDTLKVA